MQEFAVDMSTAIQGAADVYAVATPMDDPPPNGGGAIYRWEVHLVMGRKQANAGQRHILWRAVRQGASPATAHDAAALLDECAAVRGRSEFLARWLRGASNALRVG